MLLRQFILKTGLLVLITSALCVLLFLEFFPDKLRLLYAVFPFLFGAVNIFIFHTLSLVKDSTILKFSNRYLLCTTLKLLGSLVFIIVYIYFHRESIIPFLSTFLSVYFIFLFHEILSILKIFKKNEKSETSHAKT
jgi:hypothetical protein